MRVERFTDAERCRALVEPLLMQHEAANNFLIGRIPTAQEELARPEVFLGVVFDGETPVTVSYMGPPYPLVVSGGPDAALEVLADYIAATLPHVREINGLVDPARRLADAVAKRRGEQARVKVSCRIFQLDRVIPPVPVTGSFRPATPDDLELLVGWMEAFSVDIGEPHPGVRETTERRIRLGQFYLWEDPQPVSCVAWSGRTPNGVRINAVYTPPEHRGRGYASNCVATLTQQLLDEGRRFCFLYTDAANPTSNKIYQQIGYEWVCDWAGYDLHNPTFPQPRSAG